MPANKEKTLEELSKKFVFVKADYSNCSDKDKQSIKSLNGLCNSYTPKIYEFIDELYKKEAEPTFSGNDIRIEHQLRQYVLKIKGNNLALDFNFEEFSNDVKDWNVLHTHVFNFLNTVAIHYILKIQQTKISELNKENKQLKKTDNKILKIPQSLTNYAMISNNDEYIKNHQNLIDKERKKVKKLAAEFEALKDKEQFSPKQQFQLQVAGNNIKILKARINQFKKTPSLHNHFTYSDIIVISALTKLITNNNGNPIILNYTEIVNILGLSKRSKGGFFDRLKESVEKLTTEKFHVVIPISIEGDMAHFNEDLPIFDAKKANRLVKDSKTGIMKEVPATFIGFKNNHYKKNLQNFYNPLPHDFFQKLDNYNAKNKKQMVDLMTQVMLRVIQKSYDKKNKTYKTNAIQFILKAKKQDLLNDTLNKFKRPRDRDNSIDIIEHILNFFIEINIIKSIKIDKKDKENKYPITIKYNKVEENCQLL